MAAIKLEIEHRHSDWGEDAGGYSVLRFDGVWIGRIDDRAAADRLIAEVERLKDLLFCNCRVPYFGAQIVGSPLRCERCQKETGFSGPTLRERLKQLEAELARLSAPFTQEEWNGKYSYMGPRSRGTVNMLLKQRVDAKPTS